MNPREQQVSSRFRILRDDGAVDGIAGCQYDTYEEAYAVLEAYYSDLCCSDEREYYRIVDAAEVGTPATPA